MLSWKGTDSKWTALSSLVILSIERKIRASVFSEIIFVSRVRVFPKAGPQSNPEQPEISYVIAFTLNDKHWNTLIGSQEKMDRERLIIRGTHGLKSNRAIRANRPFYGKSI